MKTLDAEWKHFMKLSYDKERLKPFQELCLKRAFYAGILTALTGCIEASNAASEEAGAKQVGVMMKECLDTCAELAELDLGKPENN